MIEDGEQMKVHLDNLVVFKENRKYVFPLSDIGVIVLDGLKTTITSRLLSSMSKYNVCLVINDNKHLPCGIYTPFNQHSRVTKVLREQIEWDEIRKAEVWRDIIKNKINNQIRILELHKIDDDAVDKLNIHRDSVKLMDSSNREAHSARVYFKALFGKDFCRSDLDITNAILNYGYTIFRAYISRLIVSHGLNPSIGINHKSEYNNFCLSDDIIEIFRPIVDSYAYKKIYDSNEEIEYMTSHIRFELLDLLSSRINLFGRKVKVSTAMDQVLSEILKSLKNGSLRNLDFNFDEAD